MHQKGFTRRNNCAPVHPMACLTNLAAARRLFPVRAAVLADVPKTTRSLLSAARCGLSLLENC
jgi:hypothetical protein